MEFESFQSLFIKNFECNGLKNLITEENIEKFYHLTHLMLEKNSVMNITAIKEIEKIIPLHYADCAMIASYIPKNSKVVDIGCGGGFPTLPLSIIRSDILVTGVDSTDKKVRYVAETAKILKLDRISTISARAEELINTPQMRESFDVVTSRAVARLNILSELCIPFIKTGGYFVVMKGVAGHEELEEAKNGIDKLGGRIICVENKKLFIDENNTENRVIIVIEKVFSTPQQYPRQFGQIKKKPL